MGWIVPVEKEKTARNRILRTMDVVIICGRSRCSYGMVKN